MNTDENTGSSLFNQLLETFDAQLQPLKRETLTVKV